MKNFTFLLFAGLSLLLSLQAPASADLNDGLVLYLPFDEAPAAGAVKDESTLGNHGSVSGAVFNPTGGKLGGAYQFDGVDDFIYIPKNASLNVGAGDGLTLSAWYKTSTNSETNVQSPILEWSPGPQGPSGRAGVHLWANVYGFQWHPPTNPTGGGTGANIVAANLSFPENETNYVISTTDRPRNEWHHLVVTYDRPSQMARVYLDGIAQQQRFFDITPATDYDIYIGKRPTDYQRLMGLVDEVRVYNRALSEFEVASLYNAIHSGKMFQDFENNNGSTQYGDTWSPGTITVGLATDKAHSGARSWKISSASNWGGGNIYAQQDGRNFNVQTNRHDRLTFWVWASPQNGPQDSKRNDVAVKFFDHQNYTNGFQVWTTKLAEFQQWTELSVLFSQLPGDFNLDDIDRIEFVNFWPGTYYFDDIQVVSADRMYQSFEDDRKYRLDTEPAPRNCTASDPNSAGNCGWGWFGTVAVDNTTVKDGTQSWKVMLNDFWGGTGLKSQEKKLCMPGQCPDVIDPNPQQSFWHVAMTPSQMLSMGYDRVSFWLYSQGTNAMDNNMGIQFFDWGNYHADPIPEGFYDKQVVWSRQGATNGQWTQLWVPLDMLAPDLDFNDINKIQFQTYWPGTYYLDGIKASKPVSVIDQAVLPQGKAVWSRSLEAARYILEESAVGPNGPWTIVYSGTGNSFTLSHLSESWLRVRWESASSDSGAASYVSDYSNTVHYIAQPVLLKQASLQQGQIELRPIPQATVYEIEQSTSKNGPWFQIYRGAVPASPLAAASGKWYRARAVVLNGSNQVIDSTAWGPALSYSPNTFVKANSTVLRDQNGFGDALTLRGVNLGNAFIIEPWMLYGVSHPAVKKPGDAGYDPDVAVEDDVMFRDILTQRFGAQAVAQLMADFKEDYLKADDFDRIMRLGMNTVRLPVYYRDIRELDANLNWVGSGFNFAHVDRIIELSADRGLNVLLDLHGAPGAQSEQDNTGDKGFDKLFNDTEQIVCDGQTRTVGECYRRRTIELWQAMAARYKNNTAVVGYDLLNEPAGAQSPTILWSLYDRLYDAIRAIDPEHLIMMEGLWVDGSRWPMVDNDWDWMPDPKTYGWTNVAYQFHYYCWSCATGPTPVPPATQITLQDAFLDAKLADNTIKQSQYDVPLMIGEFVGFGVRQVWEDYLGRFDQNGISWTNWAYKTHDSPSEWGLYTHNIFNTDLPDIRNDSWEEIVRKMSMVDTANHHIPNVSLNAIMKAYLSQAANFPPVLQTIGPKSVNEGSLLSFTVSATDPEGNALTFSANPLPAGAVFNTATRTFAWTPGFNQSGTYQVNFIASDGSIQDQETVTITVNNVPVSVSGVAGVPVYFSPNSDGRADTTTVSASFNHTASWTLQIRNSSGTLVRSYSGSGTNMSQSWNGRNTSNNLVANGVYTATVTVTDAGGSVASGSTQVTKDSLAPTVSGLSDSPDPFRPSTGQTTAIRYTLSEPATVSLRIYNSGGTLVRTLVSDVYQTILSNQAVWNGRNDSNALVPAGTYTYRLWVEDRALNRTSPYPLSGTVRVK